MTKFYEEDMKAMKEAQSVYDERVLVVEKMKPLRKEGFPFAQLCVAIVMISSALCVITASIILQW